MHKNYLEINEQYAKRYLTEKQKSIENIKKGFYAAGPKTDNPELLLNSILLKEGLIDPEVANLSDDMTVEQILEVLLDKTEGSGISDWQIDIRLRRTGYSRFMSNGDFVQTPSLYKSFIITGTIDGGSQIYAHESTVLDAVRSIQRSVASLYVKKKNL